MSHQLQEVPPPAQASRPGLRVVSAPSSAPRPLPRRSVLTLLLTVLGTFMVVTCGIEAWCRWTLSRPTLFELAHAAGLLGAPSLVFEPGKGFGQAMGYLGGGLIFLTLGYPIRKHLFRSSSFGSLKTWLDVHIFFGITGTATITLHTAGHMRGIVAVCYFATLMAFTSGVIGRFLYVHLPRKVSGHEQELSEMKSDLESLATELERCLAELGVHWEAKEAKDAGASGLVHDLRGLLAQRRGTRRSLRALRRRLRGIPGVDRLTRLRLEHLASRALRKRLEVRSYSMVRHLFGSWHKFHLPFTYTLFGILALHVTVAILFYVEN